LHENLNFLLEKKRIKPYKIARDLKINQGTMGRYVKGENIPEAKNLVKIADYLGVSTDYLLGRETNIINGSVSGNAIVNGVNSGGVNINGNINQSEVKLSLNDGLKEEEEELLKIYRKLNLKNRNKLLSLAFELEEKNKSP
jgi:transcriptional regulator with XRE-family HTH domain